MPDHHSFRGCQLCCKLKKKAYRKLQMVGACSPLVRELDTQYRNIEY